MKELILSRIESLATFGAFLAPGMLRELVRCWYATYPRSQVGEITVDFNNRTETPPLVTAGR